MSNIAAVFCLVVALFSAVSFAGDKEERDEAVRRDLLERVKKQQEQAGIPPEIVKEYVTIVSDDSSDLDLAKICDALKTPVANRQDRLRRLAYVTALLFRERENPQLLTECFDSLTGEERLTIVALLSTTFKEYVNKNYLPLTAKGFIVAVSDAESGRMKTGPDQPAKDDMVLSWVDLLALSGRGADTVVLEALKYRVQSPDLRFNIVARSMTRMRQEAVPLAEWYFQRYAWQPFEVETIGTFLKKYTEIPAQEGLFGGKLAAIRKSQEALLKLGAPTTLAEPSNQSPATMPSKE